MWEPQIYSQPLRSTGGNWAWSWCLKGGRPCRTGPSTCGRRRRLQGDSVRTAVACGTPDWFWRTAWRGGERAPWERGSESQKGGRTAVLRGDQRGRRAEGHSERTSSGRARLMAGSETDLLEHGTALHVTAASCPRSSVALSQTNNEFL